MEAFKPKIFISHSTKTEDAKLFLDCVNKALEKDFEVLLDRDGLQAGDNWREKIYRFMKEAHGAVLLLSPEALESEFVPIELSVLSWRHYCEGDFVLIPVLFGDAKREDLKKGVIGRIALSVFQLINAKKPEEIVPEILQSLWTLKEREDPLRTPREIQEEIAVGLLKAGRAKKQQLIEVGRLVFGWPNKQREPAFDPFLPFACDLLKANPQTAYMAVRKLWIWGFSHTKAQQMLQLIAPFWVPEEHAKPLARVAFGLAANRAVRLETEDSLTAELYICRSIFRSLDRQPQTCSLLPFVRENSLKDITEQLLTHLYPSSRPRRRRGNPLDRLKRQLKRRDEMMELVFLLFPPEAAMDPMLLTDLRSEFSTLTFFILTRSMPLERLDPLDDIVQELQPLVEKEETDLLDQYEIWNTDLTPKPS